MSDGFEAAAFGHLRITFDARVLRPREWTAAQSRWAAGLMKDHPMRVLELCAGAGHIGLLALALDESRGSRLTAVDVNPVACEFARQNAALAGLADRVEVRHGAMADAIDPDERFDLVIADPPWVQRESVPRFPDDPAMAIDGGPDGLDIATSCLRVAEQHLVHGASLLLQVGSPKQVEQVSGRARDLGVSLTMVEARHLDGCGSIVRLVRGPAAISDRGPG